MRTITPFLFALFTFANSQAPAGTTLCDYYATRYNPTNGSEAQSKWILQFVTNAFGGNNTVFTGNEVKGILSPATFNGTTVHLIKYFDGSVFSTNGKNGQAVAVNWLDDGGVVALENGQYANTNTSNQ